MRLIDADKLKAHYSWWEGCTREMTMDEAKSDFDVIVDLQPTVEVEAIEIRAAYEQKAYNKGYADGKADTIKHGRWAKDEYDVLICSECGNTAEYLPILGQIETPYCNECGAKMDELETYTINAGEV